MIAVGAILTMSAVAFTSCSKEKTEEPLNTKHIVDEFEWIGEMHNDILWNIGVDFQNDLKRIVEDEGISEDGLWKLKARMEEWGVNYCVAKWGEAPSFLVENFHVDLEKCLNDLTVDPMLNGILDEATSMDDIFNVIERREEDISSKMATLDDTINLAALSIFKHSLRFWMDAYYDTSNPWHEITYYMPFPVDTKGLPELWEKTKTWVKEKAIPFVGEVVTAAIEFVGMDVLTWCASADEWISFGTAFGSPQFGVGCAVVFAGVGSAIGGAYGWTHPWF